jgi:hypothetical protein
MTGASRFIAVVIGLLFLGGGLAFGFAPGMIAPEFALATTAIAGMGTLRSDLGGAFLALALFTFAGARPSQAQWLRVPLIFMVVFLAMRTAHLVLDGVTPAGIRSWTVEIVLLVLLTGTHRVLTRADQR